MIKLMIMFEEHSIPLSFSDVLSIFDASLTERMSSTMDVHNCPVVIRQDFSNANRIFQNTFVSKITPWLNPWFSDVFAEWGYFPLPMIDQRRKMTSHEKRAEFISYMFIYSDRFPTNRSLLHYHSLLQCNCIIWIITLFLFDVRYSTNKYNSSSHQW